MLHCLDVSQTPLKVYGKLNVWDLVIHMQLYKRGKNELAANDSGN